MLIKTLRVGMLGTNCYIVAGDASRQAAVIDPGGDPKRILGELASADLDCSLILCTHGHMDHVGAVAAVAESTGAPVHIHAADEAGLGGRRILSSIVSGSRSGRPQAVERLSDGQTVQLPGLPLRVLHTPGHTRGSVSFFAEDSLFCGDFIFQGSIGRTDLAGGSLQELLAAVKEKVFPLPAATRIYPGHGPATTLSEERARNPYLRDL